MKFNKIITSFFSIAAASLLVAACGSNEQTAIDEMGKVDSSQGLVFKIEAEEYQAAPAKSATRTTGETVQPQEIDLGNGLVAELTIEPDTLQPEPQTRATISDGHYRIYVLNSSGQRLTGPNQSIAGTVSGGVFTPDANKSMQLEHGTYTFVCINDAVTDLDSELLVEQGAINPMIGTTTVAITQPRQEITFTMRHMMGRARFQITSYTSVPINAKIGFNFYTPSKLYYDLDGSNSGAAFETLSVQNIPFTPTVPVTYSPLVKTYKSVTDYLYFNFSTSLGGSGGDGSVQGTLYGKTFNIPKSSWQSYFSVQNNHSYLINFTIKSKTPLLLFQDGTVGYLGDKGTRTPIALVYREKTKTQQGIAMGLRGTVQEWEATTSPTYNGNNYTTAFANTDDALQDENGYNWTWTSSTDVDGLVKANQQTRYPAFYWASHDPYGVGFGEWYFPGIGEIINVFDKLAKKTNVSGMYVTFGKKLDVITNAFVSAGGTDPMNYRCWSSTIYTQPGFSSPIVFYSSGSGHGYTIEVRPQGARKNNLSSIRTFPFVRF